MMMKFVWEGRESPHAAISAEYYEHGRTHAPAIAILLGLDAEFLGPGVTIFLTPKQTAILLGQLQSAVADYLKDHPE